MSILPRSLKVKQMLSMKIDNKLKMSARAKKIVICHNKSGATIWPGDTVIYDIDDSTGSDVCVNISNTADDILVFGMAIAQIPDEGYGEIQTEGPTAILRVDGNTSISEGDELAVLSTSDYTTDVATFTKGSTTVTGGSTVWVDAHIGCYITATTDLERYRITAVATNTSLTIDHAFAGTTEGPVSYTITFKAKARKATSGQGGAFAIAAEAYSANKADGVIDAYLHPPGRVDSGTVSSAAALTLTESTAPGAGVSSIYRDNSGDTSINAISGKEVLLQVAETDVLTISGSGITAGQKITAEGGADFAAQKLDFTTGYIELGATPAAAGDIRIESNVYLGSSRNNAGSADIDLIKSNASDLIEFGANLEAYTIDGALTISTGGLTVTGNATFNNDVSIAGTFSFGAEIDASNGIDMNAATLILDADRDTDIRASSEDQIDFRTNGTIMMSITASAIDIQGKKLILDANADTSITADSDDQIDIEISGADDFQFIVNSFNVLSGSALNLADSCHLQIGSDDDIVLLHSGVVNADATLTDVIEGSPKTLAVVADSLILANTTNNGDIHLVVKKAANSFTAFHAAGTTGDVTINAATGQSVDIAIDTTDEYDFSASMLDMNANHIDNAGYIVLNPVTWVTGETGIWNESSDELHLNAKTGKDIQLEIADAKEYTFDATHLTLEDGNFIKFLGDNGIQDSNGNEAIYIEATASATNYLNVVNSNAANIKLECLGSSDDKGFTFEDNNGEEILILNSAVDSVNEVTIASVATGVAPTITASGETHVSLELAPKGDGCILLNGPITEKTTQTAKTDSVTLTIAELLTKVIDGTPTGAANYTLPTAAALVAGIEDCAVGTSFHFYINNKDGSSTITVVAGGASLDGTITVAPNVIREFVVIVTNVSTEAYFCYGLGA